MLKNANQSKPYRIYDKQTKTWFEVTPDQYAEFDCWRTNLRKREQHHHRCMCPRNKWWLCDGRCHDFVEVDYITGVMCAVADKTLSSEVGFKGIAKKVLIFLLVRIANIIDVQVIGTGSVLRTAVSFFYFFNEGVSLTENAVHLVLPILEKLKAVLKQFNDRGGNDNESA